MDINEDNGNITRELLTVLGNTTKETRNKTLYSENYPCDPSGVPEGKTETWNCKQGCFNVLSSFFRHPSAHEYYDPNDYIAGIHQEMDREELELEVRRTSASHVNSHY